MAMTMTTGGGRLPAGFEVGRRLRARGSAWTVIDLQPGADCVAVHLDPDAGPSPQRTLLFPFDRCSPLPAHRTIRPVGPARWLQRARDIAALTRRAGGLEATASTGIDLLAYQLEPALAVLRHGATRVLIADAVGLGKTVQAGVLLAELTAQTPSLRALVLVPAGLRAQWAQELDRLFGLRTVRADSDWLRSVSSDRPSRVNPWCLPGVYLASQDFVKRSEVLRPLEDVTWDLLIVDEAHASSSRTDRRAAAHAIASRATRVMLLTATPHGDEPGEFAALCELGRIDAAEPPIVLFRRSRRDAGDTRARRSALLPVRPTGDEHRMHEMLERYTTAVWRESAGRGDELARLAAIVLRKRALSSAASLALSVRRRMALLAGQGDPVHEQLRLPIVDEDPLDDAEPAAVLGAPGLAYASREQRWLAAIAEAAQRASRAESKARFVRRLLNRIHEPAIIFTEYRDTLQRLASGLAAVKPLLMLHGGMSPDERSRVQRAFNEGAAVLLATDAAAEGLNLHARCRLVLHYELPWSTSRLEQRAGRVDRLGQSRRVHELGLVAATTAERLVLGPLMRRAWRAQALGHGPSALVAGLTESRAADIVIGGAPQAPVDTQARSGPAVAVRTMHLREEAEAEVERLSARRADHRRAAGSKPSWVSQPLATSVVRGASRLPPGLILIYMIAIASAAGRRVHADAVTLSLQLPERGSKKGAPRRLQALVRPFFSPHHPAVTEVLARATRDALARASVVHGRVETSLRKRQLLMNRVRAVAARRLAQAGLFDRPAWRADIPSHPDPSSLGRDPLRPASPHVLCVDITLAAALRVIGR